MPVKRAGDCVKTSGNVKRIRPNLQTPRRTDTNFGYGKGVKFNLIDKLEHLSPQRIIAVKQVSLAEEYLADHFPTFPVLPGVLMLEAIVQAAGWLLHTRGDFSRSMAVLKEARNVKYGQFVGPGNALRIEVEWISDTPGGACFKSVGTVGKDQAVTARIEMAYFNLAERNSSLADIDQRLIAHNRSRWALLNTTTGSVEIQTNGNLSDGNDAR